MRYGEFPDLSFGKSVRGAISPNEIVITDQATGHILIDESLALLFVSYVDADFCIYIIERLSEVLLNGVVHY